MRTRICSYCKRELPETEEFFERNITDGKYGLRGECRDCRKEKYKYWHSLKKARLEKEKKDEWMEELKDKIFICKLCGQEKTFDEMRKNTTEKRMHSWCKTCYNKKQKDYHENYKVNTFKKSLELRQELLKKENEKND